MANASALPYVSHVPAADEKNLRGFPHIINWRWQFFIPGLGEHVHVEGKTIRLDLTEQEVASLHRAMFELRGRPVIGPEELRAIQSAEQKLLRAARLAGMDLHHW